MTVPRILVIAGSDSGGGAGIQADIKTITMLGGHAMTAVTAITAQNTLGVQAVMPVPTAMVLAQIDSVIGDIGVDAVKIGMLGSAETAHAVADWLETFLSGLDIPSGNHDGGAPGSRVGRSDGGRIAVVFDPVMVATSGDRLADAATIAAFERLIGLATVTTPNADELKILAGGHDGSDLGVFEAAGSLAERHATSVLATGTRIYGGLTYDIGTSGGARPERTDDFLYDRLFTSDPHTGFAQWEWSGRIIETRHDHGTGCTLASAIAVGLAGGMPLSQAVERAREFVRAALLAAPGFGQGHGPMGHQAVTEFPCRD